MCPYPMKKLLYCGLLSRYGTGSSIPLRLETPRCEISQGPRHLLGWRVYPKKHISTNQPTKDCPRPETCLVSSLRRRRNGVSDELDANTPEVRALAAPPALPIANCRPRIMLFRALRRRRKWARGWPRQTDRERNCRPCRRRRRRHRLEPPRSPCRRLHRWSGGWRSWRAPRDGCGGRIPSPCPPSAPRGSLSANAWWVA